VGIGQGDDGSIVFPYRNKNHGSAGSLGPSGAGVRATFITIAIIA
jgi:hypothetical protein